MFVKSEPSASALNFEILLMGLYAMRLKNPKEPHPFIHRNLLGTRFGRDVGHGEEFYGLRRREFESATEASGELLPARLEKRAHEVEKLFFLGSGDGALVRRMRRERNNGGVNIWLRPERAPRDAIVFGDTACKLCCERKQVHLPCPGSETIGHLFLDHERYVPRRVREVEEFSDEERDKVVRRAGDDTPPIGAGFCAARFARGVPLLFAHKFREINSSNVAVYDHNARRTGELAGEEINEATVFFNRHNPPRVPGQRFGEGTQAGSYFEDCFVRSDAGCRNHPISRAFVNQEILPEPAFGLEAETREDCFCL